MRKTLGRVSEIALKLETVLQNPKKDSNIDSQHVNIREEEKQVFVIVLIVCVVFILLSLRTTLKCFAISEPNLCCTQG